MGLLEKLWDETVAGPHPDSGLGKLRKFNTFSFRGKDNEGEAITATGADNPEAVKVTRSIMIVKPPGHHQSGAGSAPASPAGSTPPVSPFSGNRSGAFRFRRRSMSDENEKTASEDRTSRSTPPVEDV